MLRLFNPFYRTVFQKLFGHSSVARKMASCLLGRKIKGAKEKSGPLVVQPRARLTDIKTVWAVSYVDYEFHIEAEDGSNNVIETKIMQGRKPIDYAIYGRFRKEMGKKGSVLSAPLFICFLEEQVKGCDVTVLEKRNGSFVDKETGNGIVEFDSSFGWLTEGSIVVQISALENCRNETLKKVLSIFVHDEVGGTSVRTVRLDDKEFPSDYFEIVERLAFITVDVDVLTNLYGEDDYLSVLIGQERQLEERMRLIAERGIVERYEVLEKAIDVLVEKTGVSREEAEKLVRGN